MKRKQKNKKSQITIFIIIGLILIVAIALVFILIKNTQINNAIKNNPQAQIKKCIFDSLEKHEKTILDSNGYLNKTENYILFSLNRPKEKVPYLCKTSQFYTPCVNQEPMFIELIRKELTLLVRPDLEKCFGDIIKDNENAGYIVKTGNLSIQLTFTKDKINVDVQKEITLAKETQSTTYKNFNGEMLSPLYNLVDTARNIVNFESSLCEFNNVNWMRYHTDISINKFVTSDQSKVYTLSDRLSGKKLSFAVKTCVLPAGV
jgi:hypothetical protein